MRYNRADINSSIRAAQKLSIRDNLTYFVWATCFGWGIYKDVPPFHQGFYAVNGNKVESVNRIEIKQDRN